MSEFKTEVDAVVAVNTTNTAPATTTNTTTTTTTVKIRSAPPSMTVRARRRREEAVRRLVADVQSRTDKKLQGDLAADPEQHDWLVASAVAVALEKGLDRDLHSELVQEAKDNAGRIGQVCHDHADVFLASVAQVAALAEPSAQLADGLTDSHAELKTNTAGPMHEAAMTWEQARQSYFRARTLAVMVNACQAVAIQLERARKQAAVGRPRAALDAVDQARTALTAPMESLFSTSASDQALWKQVLGPEAGGSGGGSAGASSKGGAASSAKLSSLEATPFGKRAIILLPRIENEVLMSARRGLNRWFLAMRSGGDGAKAGRAVLSRCAYSMSIGPGQLGLGGHMPPSYIWRAKTADNLIARVDQNGKVARAVRQGYWFDRDAPREADRLEAMSRPGMERRAESFAAAFGWYRCWEESSALLVEPSDFLIDMDASGRGSVSSGSRHGLSGSRHGLGGSRHGLRGSRHGKGRSLGFRATTSSKSQAFQELSTNLTGSAASVGGIRSSKWSELLTPPMLLENAPTRYEFVLSYLLSCRPFVRSLPVANTQLFSMLVYIYSKEDNETLLSLPESVHPVRRAELAFNLLGRSEEFVQYYEQNRFGETKIGGDSKDDKGEKRSCLSSLTGDDVSVGSDRIFFAKTLPHLCASVVGFSAVEAALELGNFIEEDEGGKGGAGSKAEAATLSAGRFREASERYERSLVTELGNLFRGRAMHASLAELVRSSTLMSAFRASLRIVHPSSTARRHDKDLLALDVDMLMTALKVAQEEQLKATAAIVMDDQKVPMAVSDAPCTLNTGKKNTSGIPDPEEMGLPFGLSILKQVPQKSDLEFQEQARTAYNRSRLDESYTFSHSVPVVLRSIHARAIACSVFALSQEELGQQFPEKKGSRAAGYVLDCVEECINVAAVGMKDSDNVVEEGSVEKAVQVMANIAALQHCLPRLYGNVMRGMCHVGLIRADEIEATFTYAEKTLKGADKACDAQVGSAYSLVYEISRNKIDSHINYALENFQWIARSTRDMPNAYCEGLVGYLKSVFASLGPMDEGSRAGLHFSCCGHVSERLVKLLSGKPGDTTTMDDSGIAPISRIDVFGIKNMALDCEEFERFADTTAIPQLRDCFSEFRVLTTIMLDKDLPMLVLPENAAARRRKYPILSLEKVGNILEKYQGTGLVRLSTEYFLECYRKVFDVSFLCSFSHYPFLYALQGDKLMGAAGRNGDMLFMDKKEVIQLMKVVRGQTFS